MSKIALLGPVALVEPLRACGVDVFSDNFGEVLARGRHELIFVTERLARELPEELAAKVVLLPDHLGGLGLYQEKLKGLIHD